MTTGAPDWLRLVTQKTATGTAVVIVAGQVYWANEPTLTAGQNPTYTPPFTLTNLTIRSTKDITLKLNDSANDPITIKAGLIYAFSSLRITKIYITNASACTVYMFGTD